MEYGWMIKQNMFINAFLYLRKIIYQPKKVPVIITKLFVLCTKIDTYAFQILSYIDYHFGPPQAMQE